MVSVVGSEPFLSLESKRGFLTVDEELDHYRQRFQSMKLVLKELQQQVVLYKTRCTGVNTVALMLKESKQEVMKLTKQKQSLEIAVANLQNRLSTNGLASSVNIEETELFVPGPSKQTLDNLVRENARLRSLLKNHEAQAGNKSLEELQKLKTSLQILEAENSQLKVQILEFENTKHVLSSQFEEVVTKLNKEHQDKILKLEQELNHRVPRKISSSQHHEICVDIQSQSRPTQTVDVEPSNIDEMRKILKLMCAQCLTLDMSLENVLVASESGREIQTRINDQAAVRTEENYLEMEKKLNQVIQMNQRWQSYNQNREQQVHGLLARIVELEQLNQEGENLKSMMQAKDVDNLNLRKEIDNLTKEKNKLWSKPQFDVSIVEILKQQIQVCTEDFNTERKDRENAVIRSKQLQDEIQKLMNENTNLKKDMANMQEIKNTLENQNWTRPQPVQYFTSNKGLTHLHKIPFLSSSSSGAAASAASSLSPVPSPVPSFMSTSSAGDKSPFYPPSSPDSTVGFQGTARVGGTRQNSSHIDDYTNHVSREVGPVSNTLQSSTETNLSMSTLKRATKNAIKNKNRKTDLSCPRCSQEFTEDQHAELINHINTCAD